MKKLFAILLACSMLLGGAPALAEESGFTLRNGVKFGDTVDEVKAKETFEVDTTQGDEYNLYMAKGTVAGISDTEIWYRFDEMTGLLYDVRWSLPSYYSADSSDNDYSKLYKAFVSKYGDPLGYSNGSCYIITGSAIEAAATIGYLYKELLDGVGDIRDYAEWDVKVGNGEHVKIELVQYYYGTSYSDMQYYINVGYSDFTDEELENALKEKREENEAVMNDI